jgi:hypothetical protein
MVTSSRSTSTGGDDRGAVLVYAAFAMIGLIAFATLVIDYGLLWTARRQAQNVADSAALAGAIALGYEAPSDWSASGLPVTSAVATAQGNRIFGDAPAAGIISGDISFPIAPTGCSIGSNAGGIVARFCVKADVHRSAARGNALPSIFGILLGLNGQEIRATAIARSMPANATDCVRPFAVPDLYQETAGSTDTYDPGDFYLGKGYTPFNSFGSETSGSPLLVQYSTTHVNPGSFRFYDQTGTASSAVEVQRSIRACSTVVRRVGDNISSNVVSDPGFEPVLTMAMTDGINDIIGLDPNANWDGQRIVGSCVLTHSCKQYDGGGDGPFDAPTATISLRVIVLPIFNPSHTSDTTIVNFAAFFVTRVNLGTGEVEGVFVTHPGRVDPTAPTLPLEMAFLRSIQLVR